MARRHEQRTSPLRSRLRPRYDVLLVNPIKDGLNLVAKEGPIATTATACSASLRSGAVDVHESACLPVHPFDIVRRPTCRTPAHHDPSERADA